MKKNIILLLSAITICFILNSCKKFLEETSQDEIKPSSTEDLQALMFSEAYPYMSILDTYTDLLTDDIQCNGLPKLTTGEPDPTYANMLPNGANIFTWNPIMFDQNSGPNGTSVSDLLGVNSWKLYYAKINGCNVILDNINTVSGSDRVKNSLSGQALFLRAFYYLKLINLYAQPYNRAGIDPTKSLGVPLILSSSVSDNYPVRNTVAEVYSQIEKDLLKAAELLSGQTATSVYRVDQLAVYTILSRMYLYMGRAQDLDRCIEFSSNALKLKSTLTKLINYLSISSPSQVYVNRSGIFDQTLSQEIIWSYGINPRDLSIFIPGNRLAVIDLDPPYSVSRSLMSTYDRGTGIGTDNLGDMRYFCYVTTYSKQNVEYPWTSGKIGISQEYGDKGIRVAELYLNRAEACISRFKKSGQPNDLTQALSDLNTLRQSRFDTRNAAYAFVNITDADQLFKFCQEERRRELCLEENHRWTDIRRWGLSVTHTFIGADGSSSIHTLASGSPAYALQIPYNVVSRNFNLQQNPR